MQSILISGIYTISYIILLFYDDKESKYKKKVLIQEMLEINSSDIYYTQKTIFSGSLLTKMTFI